MQVQISAGSSIVGTTVLEEIAVDLYAVITGERRVAPKDYGRPCHQDKYTRLPHVCELPDTSAQPFTSDVHEDIVADLKEYISTDYKSKYVLHLALSQALKRLNDGHCVWINHSYKDSMIHARGA
ncbi:hypothetical protein C0989_012478 [Termitomyces sp. Mn162]|nr:hypothetical protein C0989_012478 [Termitomyces sp. Mn162]KAH0581277.1 hypothetical protein H2248_012378 [Termitomyces sp. 'cryptogamus']